MNERFGMRAWLGVCFIASAALLSACDDSGSGGGGPGFATITTTVSSYRMYYELDAGGRVKNYDTWDASGVNRLRWCTGDLQSSWDCRNQEFAPYASISATVDAAGRPASYRSVFEGFSAYNVSYSYNAEGQLIGITENQDSGDNIVTTTTTVEYDGADHLASIHVVVLNAKVSPLSTDSKYAVLSPAAVPLRVAMARKPLFAPPDPPADNFTIALTADDTGRYTQKIVNEVVDAAERIESKSSFTIDDRGYLTRVVSEQYQYETGATPVITTENAWCLAWQPSPGSHLASESHCTSGVVDYSIAYPPDMAPSAPVTIFPAYRASSQLDLLCVIANVCVDPKRRIVAP